MDIDLDFYDRDQALKLFEHVVASRIDNARLVKHNTGVYLHQVPVDAESGLCAIPFDQADRCGFFKLDFLNVGIYKGVRDEEHLISLMNQEPVWELLQDRDFIQLLFHVNNHANILETMKPSSVEELAAVLAIIRPGKRYLLGKDWGTVLSEVWSKPDSDEYYWKKSHAFSYAIAVVVQMNLICEQLSNESY